MDGGDRAMRNMCHWDASGLSAAQLAWPMQTWFRIEDRRHSTSRHSDGQGCYVGVSCLYFNFDSSDQAPKRGRAGSQDPLVGD